MKDDPEHREADDDGVATTYPEAGRMPNPAFQRRPAASRVRAAALLLLGLVLLLPAATPLRGDPAPGGPASGLNPATDPRDIHEQLVLANEDYLAGRYEQAVQGYEAILARDQSNGHVFYNLGNGYIRMGRVGKAILNYRKAMLLLPRDGDLKANLQHARSLRQDRTEERPASIWHTLAFWYHGLNLRGLLLLFCALNLLFWSCLLLRLFRDSEGIRWTLALSLILGVLMGISTFLKYVETFQNPDGVVLLEETPVRAGFSHKDTVLFVLHEGTEFRILDREKGCWKIELADGKKGWIPGEAGGSVSLERP